MSTLALIVQVLLVLVGPMISAASYKYFGKTGVGVVIVLSLAVNGLLYTYA